MKPLDAFANALGEFASAVTNRLIDSDAATRTRIGRLAGRSVEIATLEPPLIWHLCIEATRVVVIPGPAPHPTAVVRGTPIALLTWLRGRPDADVKIDGDVATLTQLLDLIRGFAPDPADALSQVLGADLAHKAVAGAELGMRGLLSVFEGVAHSLGAQVRPHFVERAEFDALLDRIDDLRLRVDRLAARIRLREAGGEPLP